MQDIGTPSGGLNRRDCTAPPKSSLTAGRQRCLNLPGPIALHLTGVIGFGAIGDRKSTRLNSSHLVISYAVFCLKKKKYKNANIVNVARGCKPTIPHRNARRPLCTQPPEAPKMRPVNAPHTGMTWGRPEPVAQYP